MNPKTTILIGVLVVALVATAVLSYTGFGLHSEKDPLSIRELSAQNQRNVRGGGTSYGK